MTSPCPSDHIYTHGYDASVIDGHSKRTAQNSAGTLLGMLRPGMDVLDIGSGAGTITADLAQAVAPGRVVAVELDDTAAELTRRTLEQRGINTVEVVVEDAHQLSYPDHSFDVVHAHQVLQHVADPVLILQHMWRVTRPDGIVAARDTDYTAFSWYPHDPRLERWRELYLLAARHNGGHPDAGVRLKYWAEQAGIHPMRIGAAIWPFSTPEDLTWWSQSWAQRISNTQLATQILREGWASEEELHDIADAFRRWGNQPGAYFMVPHGELIARKPHPPAAG